MKFFDLQTEFMIPLWRRVLLVVVCLLWSVVEFLNDSLLWSVIFVGLGLYALWQLFLDGWPNDELASAQHSETDRSGNSAAHDQSLK